MAEPSSLHSKGLGTSRTRGRTCEMSAPSGRNWGRPAWQVRSSVRPLAEELHWAFRSWGRTSRCRPPRARIPCTGAWGPSSPPGHRSRGRSSAFRNRGRSSDSMGSPSRIPCTSPAADLPLQLQGRRGRWDLAFRNRGRTSGPRAPAYRNPCKGAWGRFPGQGPMTLVRRWPLQKSPRLAWGHPVLDPAFRSRGRT